MASLQDSISYGGGRINVGGSTYEIGMRFHVTAPTTILSLRWWRSVTGAGVAPEIVRLWRESDTTELGRLTSVPDDGTVGWQSADLATPIDLVASTIYVVSAYFPGAGGQPSGAGPVTPDAPFVFESNYRCYHATTSGFPASNDAGSYIGVDAVAGVAPPDPGDPATIGDLSAWLSTDSETNTHQDDGLPWRTDANVTIVKGEAEGVNGFAAIKAVADAVAAAVSGLPGTIAGAVTTITGQLTALVGTVVDTSTVTIGRIIHDLAAVTINTQNSLVELARLSEGTGTFPSDVGTLVWTLLDETDFDGEIAWAQPADVYVLSITERPFRLPLNLTAGVHTLYRCGWWCPLNGSFGRQRSYIDFEDNHLAIGAERMPGVLIQLQPGGAGHLQAWALT